MALERPEAGYVWLHVPLREQLDVVIVGDVHSWWAHWTGSRGGKQNRGVRCVRPENRACAWCAAAQAPRVRYVLPVHVAGDLRLVELGRVQYSMLALMEESGGLIGRRVRLVRQWAAKNAPIEVRSLGKESLSAEQVIDIEEFVEQLGRCELATCRPPERASGVSSELGEDRDRARASRRTTSPIEAPALGLDLSEGMQELRSEMSATRAQRKGEATPERVPGSRFPDGE